MSGATLLAAEGLRVVPLVRDGAVLVSLEFADGFTEDVGAAIHSGLRTTFTYNVELRLEVPAWVDRTVSSATVSTTVEYDNLTRRYTVMRTINGRVEDTQVTEEQALVRQLLMTFRELRIFPASELEPNRDYYVRVRATMRPHNALFAWPFDRGILGQARFTFIP
jgi:hypothetical protein